MWVNVACTLVEAAGLLIIIAVGLSHWGSVDLLEIPRPRRRRPHVAARAAGSGPHVLLLHWLRGHHQRRRGMQGSAAHRTARPHPRDDLGRAPLRRGGDNGRVGRALARTRRGSRPADRGHEPRRSGVPAHRLHGDHAFRRGQHGTGELRHGLAAGVRDGAPTASSRAAWAGCMRARIRLTLRSYAPRDPRSRWFCSAASDTWHRRPCSCSLSSSPS